MMDRRITAKEVLPSGWRNLIGNGDLTIGLDPATTAKKKSNPTALALIEHLRNDYIARVVVRFKTDKPDVTRAVVRELLSLPPGRRVKKLVILATSERFFATDLRDELRGIVPVELVIESEAIEYRRERMLVKTYLGNLTVNTLADRHLWLPDATWLRDDMRQTVKEKGGFAAEVDEAGNHADCFCAIGAGLHGHITTGGLVEAFALALGGTTATGKRLSFNRPNHNDDAQDGPDIFA